LLFVCWLDGFLVLIFLSLRVHVARVNEDEDENEGNDGRVGKKGKYTHTMPTSFSHSLPVRPLLRGLYSLCSLCISLLLVSSKNYCCCCC